MGILSDEQQRSLSHRLNSESLACRYQTRTSSASSPDCTRLDSLEDPSMSEQSSPYSEPSSTPSTPTSEDRLHRLVEARYPDDLDLQEHVLDSATKAGTVDRIASGELSLPHPEDARRDLERVQRQQQRQGG